MLGWTKRVPFFQPAAIRSIIMAYRARGIFLQPHFAELHAERINQQQPTAQARATASQYLDAFHRLNAANNAGQRRNDTVFGTGKIAILALFIQAVITGRPGLARVEHADLTFHSDRRSRDQGYLARDTG